MTQPGPKFLVQACCSKVHWSQICTHFCGNWIYVTKFILLPMREVLITLLAIWCGKLSRNPESQTATKAQKRRRKEIGDLTARQKALISKINLCLKSKKNPWILIMLLRNSLREWVSIGNAKPAQSKHHLESAQLWNISRRALPGLWWTLTADYSPSKQPC